MAGRRLQHTQGEKLRIALLLVAPTTFGIIILLLSLDRLLGGWSVGSTALSVKGVVEGEARVVVLRKAHDSWRAVAVFDVEGEFERACVFGLSTGWFGRSTLQEMMLVISGKHGAAVYQFEFQRAGQVIDLGDTSQLDWRWPEGD